MNQPNTCKVVCAYDASTTDLHRYQLLANKEFQFKLILDDLPSATIHSKDDKVHRYSDSISIAELDKPTKKPKVLNHLRIVVETHATSEGLSRIVGFDVEPLSIDWSHSQPCAVQAVHELAGLDSHYLDEESKIIFTYSVEFKQSTLEWAHRLDHYKKLGNEQIHHSQLMLSAGLVILLSIVVGKIMFRVLSKDLMTIQRNVNRVIQNRQSFYQSVNTEESQSQGRLARFTQDIQIETVGWKKISGQVFRRPHLALVFSVLIGSSAQVTLTMMTILFYGMQSTLDVLHRTQIYSFAFMLVVLTGLLSGFLSARFYKLFNGTSWLRCALANALFIPSIFVGYFLVIDFVDWWERTLATPFSYMSMVLITWLLFNLVTISIGSWFGFLRPKLQVTAKVSRIISALPAESVRAPFYTSSFFTVPLGSILCFACVISEVYYLIISVWRESYYMMFLYLLLSLLMMSLVAAQVSIIQTYVTLSHSIAAWWWQAFLIGFGTAFWSFLLAYQYYFRLGKGYGLGSFIIFSGEAGLISLAIGMFAGCSSFFGSYWFVCRMYARAGARQE